MVQALDSTSTLPFQIHGTASLPVSAVSASVALPRAIAQSVIVTVPSNAPGLVFIKFGPSGGTAAATDYPMLPGSKEVFAVQELMTHFYAICPSGAATVYASTGKGL